MMNTLTETAPASVGARSEGLDQTPEKEMTLTNSPTASAVTPVARDTNVFMLSTPTPLEVDWASQFRDYTVRIRYSRETRAYSEDVGGKVYRFAGALAVSPDRKEILVSVFVGATRRDFEVLTIADVRLVREGYWNSLPWQTHTDALTGETFHKVSLGSSQYYSGTDEKWFISPCREVACLDHGGHHVVYGPEGEAVHYGDSFEREHYTVKLARYGVEPWEVSIDCDSLPASATGSFLSDIAWLTAEARNLNDALTLGGS